MKGRALLALDVGFSNTGYVVFRQGKPVHCGVLTTERSKKKTARVADEYSYASGDLARQLHDLIREHEIGGIVGELPSGGAQSAKANAQMAMANAVVSSVASIAGIPTEWTTPRAVKVAATGSPVATKRAMCEAACRRFGGEVRTKEVGSGGKARKDQEYQFLGVTYPEGKFEHIADAAGAYLALQGGILVRLQGHT